MTVRPPTSTCRAYLIESRFGKHIRLLSNDHDGGLHVRMRRSASVRHAAHTHTPIWNVMVATPFNTTSDPHNARHSRAGLSPGSIFTRTHDFRSAPVVSHDGNTSEWSEPACWHPDTPTPRHRSARTPRPTPLTQSDLLSTEYKRMWTAGRVKILASLPVN